MIGSSLVILVASGVCILPFLERIELFLEELGCWIPMNIPNGQLLTNHSAALSELCSSSQTCLRLCAKDKHWSWDKSTVSRVKNMSTWMTHILRDPFDHFFIKVHQV